VVDRQPGHLLDDLDEQSRSAGVAAAVLGAELERGIQFVLAEPGNIDPGVARKEITVALAPWAGMCITIMVSCSRHRRLGWC